MSRKRSRRDLAEQLRPHMRIEFKHAGAACPACGYIFDNGFSTYTEPDEHAKRGVSSEEETLAVCTRCRRVLAVHETGRLRVVSETEQFLLSDDERRGLDLMREILGAAGYDDLD